MYDLIHLKPAHPTGLAWQPSSFSPARENPFRSEWGQFLRLQQTWDDTFNVLHTRRIFLRSLRWLVLWYPCGYQRELSWSAGVHPKAGGQEVWSTVQQAAVMTGDRPLICGLPRASNKCCLLRGLYITVMFSCLHGLSSLPLLPQTSLPRILCSFYVRFQFCELYILYAPLESF